MQSGTQDANDSKKFTTIGELPNSESNTNEVGKEGEVELPKSPSMMDWTSVRNPVKSRGTDLNSKLKNKRSESWSIFIKPTMMVLHYKTGMMDTLQVSQAG